MDGYDSEDSSGEEGLDGEDVDEMINVDKQDEDEDMFNFDEVFGSGDEEFKLKGNKKKYFDLDDIEG